MTTANLVKLGIKDALISNLRIQSHQIVQAGPSTLLSVFPDPKEMQKSGAVNLPGNQTRITIVVTLPEFLQDRQYNLWLLGEKQPLRPFPQPLPNQQPGDRVFEMMLHGGVNVVEAHLVAAIPRSERVEGGSEIEVEVLTALVNVMRN